MQFSFREPSHLPVAEYRYSSKTPDEEDSSEFSMKRSEINQGLTKNINFGNKQALKKTGDDDPWSDYSPEHDSQSIFVEINSPNFSPAALNNEKSDRDNFTFSKKTGNQNPSNERHHIKIDLTTTSPERRRTSNVFEGNENIESLSFAAKRSDVFSSKNEDGFLKEKWKISELLLSPNMFDDLKAESNNTVQTNSNAESLEPFNNKEIENHIYEPIQADSGTGTVEEQEGDEEGLIDDGLKYFEENEETDYHRVVVGDGRKSSERRDFNEFLRSQKAFERKKEEKRKQLLELRESKLQNLFSHQPKINKKSVSITLQKHIPQQSIHQRLYLQSKIKGLANINNDKNAKRDKKTCIEDGSQKNNSKTTPRNSEILFIRKFIKDFQKVVSKIPCLKNGHDFDIMLDYVISEEILKKLGFLRDMSMSSASNSINNERNKQDLNRKSSANIENESKHMMNKIYDALSGEIYGGIKKRNLIKFLLCLMGVDIESIAFELAKDEELIISENKENECRQEEPFKRVKANERAIGSLIQKTEDGKNEYFLKNQGNININMTKHQHHASCINLSTFSSFDFFNTQNPLVRTTKYRELNPDKQLLGRFDEKGNWDLRKEEVKEIIKQFEVLKRNRLTTESLKKTKKNWNEFDFKPKVSEISKQLAAHHRQKLAHDTLYLIENNKLHIGSTYSKENSQNDRAILFTDLLVLQKNVEKLKHQKIFEEKQRQELSKFTFHPEISSTKGLHSKSSHDLKNKRSYSMTQERLNFLAAPKNKKDKTQGELEFEKSHLECTFAPDLSSTRHRKIYPMAKELISKDLGDALWRIRNQKRLEEHTDSNKYYEWNEQIDTKEMKLQSENGSSQTENGAQSEDQMAENAPQLLIDINIGNGIVKRIGINKLSVVSEIAEHFAQENSKYTYLDDNVKNRLAHLLELQVQNLINTS